MKGKNKKDNTESKCSQTFKAGIERKMKLQI